jgi:hypothetical protein
VRRLPGLLSTILVCVVALSLAPAMARSQETASRVFPAMRSDSAVWQRILAYVVGALSVTLVSAAGDPTPQPWQLQLPSDDPQRQLLLTQLRTILRARQTMPADTIIRSLKLGELVIAGDTARVDVDFEETRKCPGGQRTTGFGWATTVLVPRDPRQKFWGQAFSRTTQAGDRIGC